MTNDQRERWAKFLHSQADSSALIDVSVELRDIATFLVSDECPVDGDVLLKANAMQPSGHFLCGRFEYVASSEGFLAGHRPNFETTYQTYRRIDIGKERG